MTKNKYELDFSTVRLVAALCGDYERQKSLLKLRTLQDAQKLTLFTYTFTIETAISETTKIVGCYVETMIREIAQNVGWHKSELRAFLPKGKYYRLKKRAIYEIARNLHLIP